MSYSFFNGFRLGAQWLLIILVAFICAIIQRQFFDWPLAGVSLIMVGAIIWSIVARAPEKGLIFIIPLVLNSFFSGEIFSIQALGLFITLLFLELTKRFGLLQRSLLQWVATGSLAIIIFHSVISLGNLFFAHPPTQFSAIAIAALIEVLLLIAILLFCHSITKRRDVKLKRGYI